MKIGDYDLIFTEDCPDKVLISNRLECIIVDK
jgi:hypothetical protein